jgi:alkaline phosphatase D
MVSMNRRDVLRVAALGLATPYLLNGQGLSLLPAPTGDDARWYAFDPTKDPRSVFELSVASGDPTPSGVMLWTRVNADRFRTDRLLAFELAQDNAFNAVVARGLVRPADFDVDRDHTVRIDLDGKLGPDQVFYYRFIFDGVASVVGRCRTLPTLGANVAQLRLGIVTCQDYTNGYYAAYRHLAAEDLHFLIHMGDAIYETSGDPRFQSLPFADRAFTLPSGGTVALGLEDYRALYRTYRGDQDQQDAWARHTLIATWDDHELANDCYWDYANNAPGAPDHPFKADPGALTKLRLESMRAYLEYMPVRVQANPASTHPWGYYSLHRSFRFGALAELFMTEGRSHRSPHPLGEGEIGQRYVAGDNAALWDPSHTMLGVDQREWLRTGITQSSARWKLWGNPVYSGALRAGVIQNLEINFDLDAWDGYQAERTQLMHAFKGSNVRNLITFTGDLHTSLAGYMKIDYHNPFNTLAPWNLVGVEFMTPSISSASMKDLLYNALKVKGNHPAADAILDALAEDAIKLSNPHLKFFNSDFHGYMLATFTPSGCDAAWVSVDKNDPQSGKQIVKRAHVPNGSINLSMS